MPESHASVEILDVYNSRRCFHKIIKEYQVCSKELLLTLGFDSAF